MKICFIMYPWDRIECEFDSTLRLIHEFAVRGHTIACTTKNNLTMRDSISVAFCSVLKKQSKVPQNIKTFYHKAQFNKSRLPLAGFDAIVMRDNPPLDSMVMNFLDSVHEDAFIINDIQGLRIANNKLYTASLGGPMSPFIPNTHVSKNKDYLQKVLMDNPDGKMILKPLSGYGGRGVILVEKRARQSFRSLLDFYIGDEDNSNYVILQECIEGADQGDVRILMLNGEPIGAMKRIPAEGDMRSNIHAGGNAIKHNLSKQEVELCKSIGPKLVRDGLYFVGIDVINGKLIEINVLSPGGIARINKLNRVKLQAKYVDFVEGVVANKDLVQLRKSEFRKIIEDAEHH
ncbi:MAG: glutathione synthase [Planctomycetes bacterium]|nr:glutathione synthase [Planctomycetota bacterium]